MSEEPGSSGVPARPARRATRAGASAGASPPAARFRRTRAAHRDETAEDYVEAIEELTRSTGRARVGELARMMGVSHVTVTRIVARLAREGLARATPYRPVELTPRGRAVARRARARHEAVLAFLLAAGVPAAQAEIDAEGIEHHVSDATIRALRRVTGRVAGRVVGSGPRPGRPA